ncbi:MAG: aminoacyl-tRNA hydrolase [Pirellulaceae bacterium]
MKLIVGLGNPGRKYEETRHNVGFMVAMKVAALISAPASKERFDGEFAEGVSGIEKLLILCPHTFMNASGQSVRKACDFYKLEIEEILIICDDLNLDSGRLRLRARGSAGGQNGLKDIIRHLDSDAFPRLRVGIGSPPDGWAVTDYVLGKFAKAEQSLIEEATTRAAYAAIDWATKGIGPAMNQYNATAENAKATAGSRKTGSRKKRIEKQDKAREAKKQKPADSETDTVGGGSIKLEPNSLKPNGLSD